MPHFKQNITFAICHHRDRKCSCSAPPRATACAMRAQGIRQSCTSRNRILQENQDGPRRRRCNFENKEQIVLPQTAQPIKVKKRVSEAESNVLATNHSLQQPRRRCLQTASQYGAALALLAALPVAGKTQREHGRARLNMLTTPHVRWAAQLRLWGAIRTGAGDDCAKAAACIA